MKDFTKKYKPFSDEAFAHQVRVIDVLKETDPELAKAMEDKPNYWHEEPDIDEEIWGSEDAVVFPDWLKTK